MKNKTILKIISVFVILPILLINIMTTEGASNSIDVKYEYNPETNKVIAKIISTTELKDTKPTWKLSTDKKTYSKEYSENQKYNTEVVDINGNKTVLEINITQIKELKLNMQYEYNKKTGQVVAKIVSNIELKNTKPTWNLSSDKLTYTKIYTENMTYQTSVQDKFGNTKNVTIVIDQIGKEKPIITVQKQFDEEKNQVLVTMTSDVPLKNTKPTWKLSSDKLSYTKIYTNNINYSTSVEDIYGNVVSVSLNINEIDETPPQITVEYKYNDNETVTVYMKSNEILKNTKPTWTLSADKKTYEKTYTERSQNYNTQVQDLHGLKTDVKIDFKFIKLAYNQEDMSKIEVRYLYTNHKKADVEIISTVPLKNTKPTWKYSEDGYKFTKTFYEDQIYGTTVQDQNGVTKNVNLIINISDKYLNGIDVSVYQGEINWEEVKKSGIDFAIIRCGYGQDMTSQDDKQFVRNITECERLGIPYGIYIYSYALNMQNVLSEADHVLRLIKGYNPQYGIWLDLEDDDYKILNGMPTNETFVEMAVAFCDKIKANGYNNVGIYANLYWWDYILNNSKLDKYNKWVAQWAGTCSYKKPYKIWQYSESGSVKGINGNVDMNIYYK